MRKRRDGLTDNRGSGLQLKITGIGRTSCVPKAAVEEFVLCASQLNLCKSEVKPPYVGGLGALKQGGPWDFVIPATHPRIPASRGETQRGGHERSQYEATHRYPSPCHVICGIQERERNLHVGQVLCGTGISRPVATVELCEPDGLSVLLVHFEGLRVGSRASSNVASCPVSVLRARCLSNLLQCRSRADIGMLCNGHYVRKTASTERKKRVEPSNPISRWGRRHKL